MQILNSKDLMNTFNIDDFKGGAIFGALSSNAISYLLEQGVIFQLEKDERAFAPGDAGDCFYIILKGRINFSYQEQGETCFSRDFVFGEQIGFVAMIALLKQIGFAQAVEESVVLQVPSSVFHVLHDTLPTDFGILLLNLSREMARLIREYTVSG